MIVVASFSGAPQHPAWYLNLTDTGKNGEVYVKTKERAFYAAPEILDGDDYRNVWKALTEDRPFYREYQTRTNRRIPLVRLMEARPA
jgi:deazaflavin-dependent oxidoreductase (nitroreductase family)